MLPSFSGVDNIAPSLSTGGVLWICVGTVVIFLSIRSAYCRLSVVDDELFSFNHLSSPGPVGGLCWLTVVMFPFGAFCAALESAMEVKSLPLVYDLSLSGLTVKKYFT